MEEYYILADLTDRVLGLACGDHLLDVHAYYDRRYPNQVQVIHATDVENLDAQWHYCAHCGENVR